MIVIDMTNGRRIGAFINSQIKDFDTFIDDTKAFLFASENKNSNDEVKRFSMRKNHSHKAVLIGSPKSSILDIVTESSVISIILPVTHSSSSISNEAISFFDEI